MRTRNIDEGRMRSRAWPTAPPSSELISQISTASAQQKPGMRATSPFQSRFPTCHLCRSRPSRCMVEQMAFRSGNDERNNMGKQHLLSIEVSQHTEKRTNETPISITLACTAIPIYPKRCPESPTSSLSCSILHRESRVNCRANCKPPSPSMQGNTAGPAMATGASNAVLSCHVMIFVPGQDAPTAENR